MLNVLNLAGCVSPLLLNLKVLGVSKHVMLSLFLARREAILTIDIYSNIDITNSPKSKVLFGLYGRLSFSPMQPTAQVLS